MRARHCTRACRIDFRPGSRTHGGHVYHPRTGFTAIDFEAANSDRCLRRGNRCRSGRENYRNTVVLIRPFAGLESLDKYAMRVHGITPQMVTGAPSLEESMQKLATLIGDGPVLAHNIGYDAAVLRRSFEIAGLPQRANEFRCTEMLSRIALWFGKHKLHLVAQHLGLPGFELHDAGADALTCGRIAIEIGRRRGATSISDLYRGLGIPPL